jgi:RimJ/RimL family protein N-acetyltransferase
MFSADDVPAYASFCSDPEVMRFIGAGEVQPPEMTWRSVAGMLGQWQLLGYGMWALALRSTGELIGRVGFIDPPGWPGFELGWLLGRQYWGNGYAREGAAAALQQAHGTLGKQRVISLIRPGNTRSAALARTLGARRECATDFMSGTADVYVHVPEPPHKGTT